MFRTVAGLAAALLVAVSAAAPAAVDLPPGFRTEHVVQGPFLGEPVGFAFLPDERIVLVERGTGIVRLAAAGAASSDVIHTIPDVNGVALERGLLGVAVDPEWPARPYLYFQYTHADSFSRVVMYAASGDLDEPASTAVTLADPFFLLAAVRDSTGVHNGGTLRFGPDGMLYVSFGDDAQSCRAQELESPLGKILRLDARSMPGAGSGPPPKSAITPADNPFPLASDWGRLVWSWGHRNPFRFTIDPATGDTFVGDVGWHWFEEIDLIPAGSPGLNFGWPQLEADRPVTEFGDCGAGREFTGPIAVLANTTFVSIVGGPVYRPAPGRTGRFPPGFRGDLFFLEFFSGDVFRLRRTGTSWEFVPGPGRADSVWAAGFGSVADFQQGPDGALWLAAMGFGTGLPAGLHRISSTRTATVAPSPDHLSVRPDPARSGTEVVPPEGSAGPWSLTIFDVRGRRVRTISGASDPPPVVRWDGHDARGRRASAGVYALRWRSGDGTRGRGTVTLVR